ncbi:hypothetical protein DITRI_Ditri07aG0087000 [Diplodiscus trichospermus]
MMSTVGLELRSFINPNLTWKTVSKGNRSGTRRSRKPGTKSLARGTGLAEKNARTVEDVAVSESEKLSVDVLGRRFSEKVEHVPIKKRRFVFRSPSPPSPLTPSPHIEAYGQHIDFQTSPEIINDAEDFSGIEILAAAACSDSIGDDFTEKNEGNPLVEESTKERVESSASAIPLGETSASMETACCSPKESVIEGKSEGSSFQVNSFAVLDESHGDKENTTAERSTPLPDDRLLWDLNLSMDAWACDGGNVASQKDAVDNISLTSEVLQTKPSEGGNVDSQNDAVDNISVTSEVQSKPSDGGNVASQKDAVDIISVTREVQQSKPSARGNVDSRKDAVDNISVTSNVLQTKPSDGGNVDSLKDAVGGISVTSKELLPKEPQDINDTMNKVVSSDVDGGNNMTADFRTIPVGADDTSGAKQESEGCSGSNENKTKHFSLPVVDVETSLMSTSVGTNAIMAVNMDQCLSHSPFPGSDKSTWVSEEGRETHNVKLNMVGCIFEADVGKTVSVETVQVEESDVASPCVPVLGIVANDIQNPSTNKHNKDRDRDYGLDVKIFAQDLDNSQALESCEVEHANGADEMDICHFSPKSEDMSISDDYVIEAMELTDGASSAYIAQVDSITHAGSEVLLQKSTRNSIATSGADEFSTHKASGTYVNGPISGLSKANLNNPPKESPDSVVSEAKVLTIGIGNHSELQAGYDSQFEDGELRESDVQCWEEAEQVDYDSEFEDERSFGLESESGEQKVKVERGSSPDVSGNFKYCEAGKPLRDNSVSLTIGTVEVHDGETKQSYCLDGSDVRDHNFRVDFSKVSKREFHSCVEGSLSADVVQRSRSENFDGTYPRAERETGSDKFMGRDRSASHMRGRNSGGSHFFNPPANYWDSKRQSPPIYHGPCNFGHARPKNIVQNRGYPMTTDQALSEDAGVVRPDNRVNRQFVGPSNGVYRPILRRRSPVGRDDSYGMHTRMPTIRDNSPDRTRFRRYPQGVNRGIRDEYLRHIPDDGAEYCSRMPHRLGRRERSISPDGGRPHYTVPYKRTRSRSRSPIGWLLQRDLNEGSRRRSRSPDFRSDARIERARLPFTKRFGSDYGEFISPPRSRISPQRNSRMFEDRNSGLDNFWGRKLPVRMFRQRQRIDQMRPIRRLNSDDYLRPMIRTRRFPDLNAGGKGCKYEGSDDDKHGTRCEMITRGRRYDTDGAVRRLRYHAEDSYVANNSLTPNSAVWGLI